MDGIAYTHTLHTYTTIEYTLKTEIYPNARTFITI